MYVRFFPFLLIIDTSCSTLYSTSCLRAVHVPFFCIALSSTDLCTSDVLRSKAREKVSHTLSECSQFVSVSHFPTCFGKVMDSRIGTEMLTEHFLSLMKRSDKNHVGIVDTKCDPVRICQQAIDHILSLSQPQIKIVLTTKQTNIEFSFISMYLFYIIEESLKNSVSATLR